MHHWSAQIWEGMLIGKQKSKTKDNDDKSLEESKEELREEEDEDLMEGENRDRKRQRELSDRKQNRR